MSVQSVTRGYSLDGRLVGAYVYVVLCQDDGPIYAKVGVTSDFGRRLIAIKNACPVEARYMFFLRLPGRALADGLETALHAALKCWGKVGEWYQLTMEDKPEFNARLKSVLSLVESKTGRLTWERFDVRDFLQLNINRRNWFLRNSARKGRAFVDFMKAG